MLGGVMEKVWYVTEGLVCMQIVEHRESWNVSALDAIKQIFARGK